MMFGVHSIVLAQTGSVEGTVVDRSDEPLISANVFLEIDGEVYGTAVDIDGSYEITDVPAGTHEIQVRSVGYRNLSREIEILVGETIREDFTLSASELQLDELVVTGAGAEIERERLGHTISSFSPRDIELEGMDFSDVLQGRISGVDVSPAGGFAGAAQDIRIRGSSSLSMSNQPLVYVDGVRMDSQPSMAGVHSGAAAPSRLDNINPEAIERVEVLKGPSAATLYGSQANAGVIQIFTQRGELDMPTQVNYSSSITGYQWPNVYPANTGFARTEEQAQNMSAVIGRQVEPFEIVEEDIYGQMTGLGLGHNHSLNISGGSENVSYFVGARYSYDEGPLDVSPEFFMGQENIGNADDTNRRFHINANTDIQLTQDFRIRFGSSYANNYKEIIPNANYIYGVYSLLTFAKPEFMTESNPQGIGAFATVRETLQQEVHDQSDQININTKATYNFTEELLFESTVGFDVTNQHSVDHIPYGRDVDGFVGASTEGAITRSERNVQEWTTDNRLTWITNFGPSISSTFIAGGQTNSRVVEQTIGSGETFPGPGLQVLDASDTRDASSNHLRIVDVGLFAQEQLGIRDFFFLTPGVRLDASSAFGEDIDFATYPKLSASFIPLRAFGLENLGQLSSLRFRAAIGQSGLQPGAFDAFTTYTPMSSDEGPGVGPGNLGNPELRPEVATEIEVGTEIGLFNDRVASEVTYWHRNTEDALVSRQYATSGGFTASQLSNIGTLHGQGLDIELRGTLIETGGFNLRLNASASYLHEEVTSMGGAPDIEIGYVRYRNEVREGYAPGSFFAAKIADLEHPIDLEGDGQPTSRQDLLDYFADPRDPTEFEGATMLQGEDGQPLPGGEIYNDHYIGKPYADWSGNVGFNLSYNNISLSTSFAYKAGNYYTHNMTSEFRHNHPALGRNIRESTEAEKTLISEGSSAEERLEAGMKWLNEFNQLTPYDGMNAIERADFVRWRDLSVTYRLPVDLIERLGLQNASFTLQGRNLAIWTGYSGVDPEVNVYNPGGGFANQTEENFLQGVDFMSMPIPREITGTLRLQF